MYKLHFIVTDDPCPTDRMFLSHPLHFPFNSETGIWMWTFARQNKFLVGEILYNIAFLRNLKKIVCFIARVLWRQLTTGLTFMLLQWHYVTRTLSYHNVIALYAYLFNSWRLHFNKMSHLICAWCIPICSASVNMRETLKSMMHIERREKKSRQHRNRMVLWVESVEQLRRGSLPLVTPWSYLLSQQHTYMYM